MSSRHDIFSETTDIVIQVNNTLMKLYGKKLWRVNETDALRLLRLRVWQERYSISLEFILGLLVDVFSKSIRMRSGKKLRGIGVSIPVLTGDVAEEILQEKLRKEFPGREHYYDYLEEHKRSIENLIDPMVVIGKPRSVLTYKNVSSQVAAYKDKIVQARDRVTKAKRLLSKMPFRDNPYR